MHRDARARLLILIRRATSPTDEQDQEARTAAVQACRLLLRYPELVAPSAAPGPLAQDAPGPRRDAAPVHPDAARLREWRAMLDRKGLREGHASRPSICADCGKPIAASAPVVERAREHLSTHLACAAWWCSFRAPSSVALDIAS